MSEKPTQEIQLQIEMDEATAQGAYSNLAMVNHSPTEFTLDFIYVQPQQPKARVRSRVILSPLHMKRFMAVMQENLARYERAFGTLDIARMPEGPMH